MNNSHSLNAICPYFTMFPLGFPMSVLDEFDSLIDESTCVFDPFCGRGTTNFAARLKGLHTIGIDSNPVAATIAKAKIASVTPNQIIKAASYILKNYKAVPVPTGEFWHLAYAPQTLSDICRIRASLLKNCASPARVALKAIMLGALHGPKGKQSTSYFSNQAPRTYAPKPKYAVNYWTRNNLQAEDVDVLQVISKRANLYYGETLPDGYGLIVQGNSCQPHVYSTIRKNLQVQNKQIGFLITSPPYYGLKTYMQDQWIRNWFSGGSEEIEYSTASQIKHSNVNTFTSQLNYIWNKSAMLAKNGAVMMIRFGAINSRMVSPELVIKKSLEQTSWDIIEIKSAGVPPKGRRAMESFGLEKKYNSIEEIDVYAVYK